MNAALSTFQPATTRAKLVCGCLVLHSVLADLTIANGALLALYAMRLEGATARVLRLVFEDSMMVRVMAAALLHIVTFLIFVVWLMRVFDNLSPLEAGRLRFGRMWAVLSFLIPGACFVLPPYFLRTAWYGSDPACLAADGHQQWPPAWRWPTAILLWWGLFWAAYVSNAAVLEHSDVSYRLFRRGSFDAVPHARVTGCLEVVAGVLYLASCLVTIRMVRQLTRWQIERHGLQTRATGDALS